MSRDGSREAGGFTYGTCFTAIANLLSAHDFRLLADVLTRHLKRPVRSSDLSDVRVYLEKHGEFYHPARAVTGVAGEEISLVINTALSEAGRATIDREFHLIERLHRADPTSGLPRVYWMGDLQDGGKEPPSAFIGEWFSGYHEFHWSRDPEDSGKVGLVVWDPFTGPRFLPERRIPHLFSRAAEILTGLYDIETFSQVFPWHHAAGDFVVNDTRDPLDVRLITVRNHIAFLGTEGPPDEEARFQALLLFFVVTGIRMRLDRLDGVGDPFWAPDLLVEATTKGFFRALGRHGKRGGITANGFLERMTQWSACDLVDIADPLADLIALGADEAALIRAHLEPHFEAVADVLQGLCHRMHQGADTSGENTI